MSQKAKQSSDDQSQSVTRRIYNYTRVTSAGRLEVDGRKLFRDASVKTAVEALRRIPTKPSA